MDLQLFAERTEEPTSKKLRTARNEGRVAKSQDLLAGAGLIVATMALRGLGPSIIAQISGGMTDTFAGLKPIEMSPDLLGPIMQNWALLFLKVVLPIAGAIVAIGVFGTTLQTRFLVTLKPLVPKFSSLNPISGLSRMFSMRSLVELTKGIIKLTIIGYITYLEVKRILPHFPNLMEQSISGGAMAVADMAVAILQRIGWTLLVIGIFDYGYQYWEFRRSLKMTKDEVKQEHKEQEGSPEVKSKQRQKAREMALRRKALQDVPLADVVVTNPTHYAIALKYDAAAGGAPKVLAKGADILAQRIKVIARQHEIPTVENRPLARGLYDSVDVGKPIPPEFYQAVAEVLAFVYNLRRQQRQEFGERGS